VKTSLRNLITAAAASALVISAVPAFARSGNSQTGTTGPVHGPGSSHNPIVYHPVHGPGSTHNPILATKPVVRDHRKHGGAHGGGPNGGSPSPEGGVTVTSGSGRNKVVVPTKLGDYPVYGEQCNGLCNGTPVTPIVHEHR
jgi:hypothetical protein